VTASQPSEGSENVIEDFLLNVTPSESETRKLEFDVVDDEPFEPTPEEQQCIDLIVEEVRK